MRCSHRTKIMCQGRSLLPAALSSPSRHTLFRLRRSPHTSRSMPLFPLTTRTRTVILYSKEIERRLWYTFVAPPFTAPRRPNPPFSSVHIPRPYMSDTPEHDPKRYRPTCLTRGPTGDQRLGAEKPEPGDLLRPRQRDLHPLVTHSSPLLPRRNISPPTIAFLCPCPLRPSSVPTRFPEPLRGGPPKKTRPAIKLRGARPSLTVPNPASFASYHHHVMPQPPSLAYLCL